MDGILYWFRRTKNSWKRTYARGQRQLRHPDPMIAIGGSIGYKDVLLPSWRNSFSEQQVGRGVLSYMLVA